MSNRSPEMSDAVALTLRRTHEIPLIGGRYFELFYGKSQMRAYIDASQASPLSPGQFERSIYTDRFYDPVKKAGVEPDEDCLYVDDNIRLILHKLIEGNRYIIIDDIPFEIHQGKRINKNDQRPCSIITDPKNREKIKTFLASQLRRQSDNLIGKIAMTAYQQGASTIVGSINNAILEINRPRMFHSQELMKEQHEANTEKQKMKKILMEYNGVLAADGETVSLPFLQISLQRKKNPKNKEDVDIVIDTQALVACDWEISEWFFQQFQELAVCDEPDNELKIRRENINAAGDYAKIDSVRRKGRNMHLIQVAVCRQLPLTHINKIARILYQMVEKFTHRYGAERGSEIQGPGLIQSQIDENRSMFEGTLVSNITKQGVQVFYPSDSPPAQPVNNDAAPKSSGTITDMSIPPATVRSEADPKTIRYALAPPVQEMQQKDISDPVREKSQPVICPPPRPVSQPAEAHPSRITLQPGPMPLPNNPSQPADPPAVRSASQPVVCPPAHTSSRPSNRTLELTAVNPEYFLPPPALTSTTRITREPSDVVSVRTIPRLGAIPSGRISQPAMSPPARIASEQGTGASASNTSQPAPSAQNQTVSKPAPSAPASNTSKPAPSAPGQLVSKPAPSAPGRTSSEPADNQSARNLPRLGAIPPARIPQPVISSSARSKTEPFTNSSTRLITRLPTPPPMLAIPPPEPSTRVPIIPPSERGNADLYEEMNYRQTPTIIIRKNKPGETDMITCSIKFANDMNITNGCRVKIKNHINNTSTELNVKLVTMQHSHEVGLDEQALKILGIRYGEQVRLKIKRIHQSFQK